MKKYLFLLGMALSTSLHTHAQQPIPSNYSRADTARAVHSMFGSHRTGGIVWTVIGAAFTGRIIGAAAGSGDNAGGAVVGVAVFGGLPLGIGIGKLARFSGAREKSVLADYDGGKALPAYVQRRLKKAKYFAH